MNVRNVSFTGTMLVNGHPKDLKEIDDNISKKAYVHDKNGDMVWPPKDKFDYESICHEGGWSKDERTYLLTTKEDAPKLRKYFRAQEPIMKGFNGFKAAMQWQNGNPDPFLDHSLNQDKFYNDNISKYVKLPDKVVSANEVLTAMKEGLFDFANLIIKIK